MLSRRSLTKELRRLVQEAELQLKLVHLELEILQTQALKREAALVLEAKEQQEQPVLTAPFDPWTEPPRTPQPEPDPWTEPPPQEPPRTPAEDLDRILGLSPQPISSPSSVS